MELLSFKNRNVEYLLYVIEVFTIYEWVKSLKVKKCKTVINDLNEKKIGSFYEKELLLSRL